MCEWGGQPTPDIAALKTAILNNPVKAVQYGDTRINTVYAKYLDKGFEELKTIPSSELSPVEKAIILFAQATNTQNTAERIKTYQLNILSLLDDSLSADVVNTIFNILDALLGRYIEALKKESIPDIDELLQGKLNELDTKIQTVTEQISDNTQIKKHIPVQTLTKLGAIKISLDQLKDTIWRVRR